MRRFLTPTSVDVARLAQCHRSAFPHALSTAMGQRYVEKMLEWYLVDDRAFIFLIEEDGACVGYCGGLKFDGSGRVGSASSMIQHSYHQAVKTFLSRPWLFFHPEFLSKYGLAWKNVVRRVKRRVGTDNSTPYKHSENLPDPHTGLIVIGVDPRLHGRGYGSLLLQEFERLSTGMGFKKMMLTVRTDNEKAIKFYHRNSWKTAKVDGKSTTMEKRLA